VKKRAQVVKRARKRTVHPECVFRRACGGGGGVTVFAGVLQGWGGGWCSADFLPVCKLV
jgi:hypothetical protein